MLNKLSYFYLLNAMVGVPFETQVFEYRTQYWKALIIVQIQQYCNNVLMSHIDLI